MDESIPAKKVSDGFNLEEFAHRDLLEMLKTPILYTKSYPGNPITSIPQETPRGVTGII